jgi:hypothetical protein
MILLDTLTLPCGLVWTDQYASQAVAQTIKRTLAGSLVVFHAGHTAGREITLESTQDSGWFTRTQVEALALLATGPGAIYVLEIHGETYSVMFRHHQPPALEARPLWPYDQPRATDFFLVTLKLITIF